MLVGVSFFHVMCCAAQVGAKLVPVQLQPPNWDIPRQQLEQAFNSNTKLILVNTPHNPTGKVRACALVLVMMSIKQLFSSTCTVTVRSVL